MQLFYSQNIVEDKLILGEEDARHCKVLRKNVGDRLHVMDGNGHLYEVQIVAMQKHNVETDILNKSSNPKKRNYYFHLFIAPTKQNERIEWMLEKCIETGMDAITFLNTTHSEKTRINKERLIKIAVSAMKQSGEFYMPQINEIGEFKEIISTVEKNNINLIAHCNSSFEKQTLKTIIGESMLQHPTRINCFIGPEGDFSDAEIELAYKNGFKGLSLGSTRLRTETAGLYCAMGLSNLY